MKWETGAVQLAVYELGRQPDNQTVSQSADHDSWPRRSSPLLQTDDAVVVGLMLIIEHVSVT